MGRFTGLIGLAVLLGVAYTLSTARHAIRWRTVVWGLCLQIFFAVLVIKWTVGQKVLKWSADHVTAMLGHAADGSILVFGPQLGDPHSPLAVFAFAVLPTIIFVSALFAMLYHLGIMQRVIQVVAWAMQRTMGTSGAESTNVAASIFMGQTEAPLTIRPFLGDATQSELMTIMTSGMAHVSGGIMAAYILFGIHAQDLLSAVIMTAPGTILIAKMLVPETEVPATLGTVKMPQVRGAQGREPRRLHRARHHRRRQSRLERRHHAHQLPRDRRPHQRHHARHLQRPLGARTHSLPALARQRARRTLLSHRVDDRRPLAGCEDRRQPHRHARRAQRVHRLHAARRTGEGGAISARTLSIATFALCGFANIGSVGMQIGGIGALIPHRRNDLARLGMRALLAGTMANLMSASIVSMLLPK